MRREPTLTAAHDARLDPDDDLRPLGGPKPFARARLAARFAFAAAVIAGLAFAARERTATAAAPRAWTEPPTSASGPAAKPTAEPRSLLALDSAAPPAQAEPPRWNAATGLREDALAQGGFDAIEAPYLRVTLTEAAAAPPPAASLFVTLARRAAETHGLAVVRTGLRGVLDSKFGRFETVELTLSGEGARQCLGFSSLDARAMRIDGWLCGLLGQAPKPQAVACALDGLRLAAPSVPTIELAFGEADARRIPACGRQAAADATGSITKEGTDTAKHAAIRPARLTKK